MLELDNVNTFALAISIVPLPVNDPIVSVWFKSNVAPELIDKSPLIVPLDTSVPALTVVSPL